MIDAAPHMFMEILWKFLCGKGFEVRFERGWAGRLVFFSLHNVHFTN